MTAREMPHASTSERLTPPTVVSRPLEAHRARATGHGVHGAIVHSMAESLDFEGQALYAPDALKAQKLSVHAMVTPDGQILACVGVQHVAYHAGKSRFAEETDLNECWLGAEFLVAGHHDWPDFKRIITAPAPTTPYTESQYKAGGWLYATWMLSFPTITVDRIVAHQAVAGDDVRGPGQGKLDPGPTFNWSRFHYWLDRWTAQLTDAP